MEYKRRALENLTVETRNTFKCILVTGARQTGKSTMLKHLFPEMNYVTLDDEFIMDQANSSPRFFLELNSAPVIIDEVQKAPGLFPMLKIRCDESPEKGRYCLSGSQPLRLMENVSESLAGRVGIIELSPLSLREIAGDPFNRPFLPTMEYITARRKTVVRPESIWKSSIEAAIPKSRIPRSTGICSIRATSAPISRRMYGL